MEYIHATNLQGLKNLVDIETGKQDYDEQRGYICCSSKSCSRFVEGYDFLTIIEGEAIENFSGDIGFTGGSARATQWDEIHVANGFHIVGLYIPNKKEYTDDYTLQKTAFAKYYSLNFLDYNLDVIFDNDVEENIKEKFNKFYDSCYELSDEELQEIFEEENI